VTDRAQGEGGAVIIRRVHVRRFRKLADQTLACGRGLNVVRGRNDAGKSTLHLAFSAVLYPVKPADAQTYGPWGGEGPAEVVLEFETDGRAYRLRKDFASRKVSLTCSGHTWDTPKAVEEEIGRLLGIRSLSLFRATAHISQWELAAVQKEQQEIGAQLARIMTGGDGDAARVLKALDDKIRRMEVGLRGVAKSPGPLKRDEDRIATLAADRQRLAGEVARIEQADAERDRLRARIADLDRQVSDGEALLDANRRLRELDARCEELQRRAMELRGRLDQVEAAARAVQEAERDEALATPLCDPDALRALHEAALRAEMLQREADEAASRGAEHETPRGLNDPAGAGRPAGATPRGTAETNAAPWPARAVPYGIVAAIAAAIAGAGVLLELRSAWGVGLLLAAVFLGAAALLAHRRRARTAVEVEFLARQRAEAARRVAAQRQEARDLREQVQSRLRALGVSSIQEALEQRERHLEADRKRHAARQVLEAALGGRARESLAEEYQRTLVDLGAARSQRDAPDLAARRLDPEAFQRAQADAVRRKAELDAARADLQRLEGRIDGRLPHEDLARVEEELAATRARLARERHQVEVLALTRDVLQRAHTEIVTLGKERLERLASEYLRGLSGGVYERLRVDGQTLAPEVWVGPPKEWAEVAAREIGSGGVDQCYLALRLGLADLLCAGRRPPLFLDDPLLAYDDHRQAAAMALLRQIARGRQIFLFTCRSAYDAYADCLLCLDEMTAATP
jgi:hypothetical protein